MESLPSISKYFTDPVLASPSGHALLADVLIAFFQVEICRGWEIALDFEAVNAQVDTELSTNSSSTEAVPAPLESAVAEKDDEPESVQKDKEARQQETGEESGGILAVDDELQVSFGENVWCVCVWSNLVSRSRER
jgi:hypothetical protein